MEDLNFVRVSSYQDDHQLNSIQISSNEISSHLRHAKSSWKHPEQSDHDKPLNKRGKHHAPLMGLFIKNENLLPEFIITSDAKGASPTAKMVAKGEISLNKSLYAAQPTAYIDVLHDLSNEYVRVLIVSHNPELEELAGMLTQEEEHELSTFSLVHIKLPINKWTELDCNTKGKLLGICHPRDLSKKDFKLTHLS